MNHHQARAWLKIVVTPVFCLFAYKSLWVKVILMEKAAKVLEKICNRINHKIKNNGVTNTFKEHKYFQQNPVCQSLTSIYYRMVSFGEKIRLIPNLSHACTLVYAIKYICY